jgi:hypothetical protein
MTEPDFRRIVRETHNEAVEACAKMALLCPGQPVNEVALAILKLKVDLDEPNRSSHLESTEAP